MPSAYDLYTFYLEPEILRGRSVAVVVEQSIVEEVFNPRARHDEPKIVLRFYAKKLGLCLNKTQVGAMIEIYGTYDYSKWVGHTVTFTPSCIDGEWQTITITPAAATAPLVGSGQQQARVDAEEEYKEDTGS